tara:strand:- start:22 stop:300 length:279 start_codon:yes stop_codon:yes gene_type:complete
MKRVNVTPVVSQTSSNTGCFDFDRAIGGASTVEERNFVELAAAITLPLVRVLNALAGEVTTANRIQERENFILYFVLTLNNGYHSTWLLSQQ